MLSPGVAEPIASVLLAAGLAWAVARPRGWPEATVAVPAAGLVIATGAISLGTARRKRSGSAR